MPAWCNVRAIVTCWQRPFSSGASRRISAILARTSRPWVRRGFIDAWCTESNFRFTLGSRPMILYYMGS
jgi:hypothetical protein